MSWIEEKIVLLERQIHEVYLKLLRHVEMEIKDLKRIIYDLKTR